MCIFSNDTDMGECPAPEGGALSDRDSDPDLSCGVAAANVTVDESLGALAVT